MSQIDYTPYPQFNAEYLERIRLIKEKYEKKKEKLFVMSIKTKAKNIQYYHDKLDLVFDLNNATPISESKYDILKSSIKFKKFETGLIEIK